MLNPMPYRPSAKLEIRLVPSSLATYRYQEQRKRGGGGGVEGTLTCRKNTKL